MGLSSFSITYTIICTLYWLLYWQDVETYGFQVTLHTAGTADPVFCLRLSTSALASRRHSRSSHLNMRNKRSIISADTMRKEDQLLSVLTGDGFESRGATSSAQDLHAIDSLVSSLEDYGALRGSMSSYDSCPTRSPLIDGCWKLLYTSSPGTNSPIQRTFTALDSVSIYQVVNLLDTTGSFLPNKEPDVSNIVCFGERARLRVTALGSTADMPLIVPRRGNGKIFGMNIFGVSSSEPPRGEKAHCCDSRVGQSSMKMLLLYYNSTDRD